MARRKSKRHSSVTRAFNMGLHHAQHAPRADARVAGATPTRPAGKAKEELL